MAQYLFVGRESEQRAYQELITQKSPLVMVITRVGGCGKTELLLRLVLCSLKGDRIERRSVLREEAGHAEDFARASSTR